MATILRQVALVSETPLVTFPDLAIVSAAIQKQVTRDLAPIWEVEATVDAFTQLDDIPPGYWPVIIVTTDPNADDSPTGGIHLDRTNQPFAVVEYMDHWSLVASHETLEMLVDPFGNRLLAGDSPMQGQGRVEFLVEVCDPSEASEFSYTSNGIVVSDFYTPHYFDPVRAPGVRYSFTDFIKTPRQVLKGGYLSWHEPVSDIWWQQTFFSGSDSKIDALGKLTEIGASLRAQIDKKTQKRSLKAMMRGKAKLSSAVREYSQKIVPSSKKKAMVWREHIEQLRSLSSDGDDPGPQPATKTRRRKGTAKDG